MFYFILRALSIQADPYQGLTSLLNQGTNVREYASSARRKFGNEWEYFVWSTFFCWRCKICRDLRAFWTAFMKRVMSCNNCTFLSSIVGAETVSFPGIRAWRKSNLTKLKLKIIVFSHEPSTWWEDILDQFCHQFENSLMLSPIQFVPVPFKKLFSILYTLEPRTFIISFKAVSFTGRVSIGCIQNPSCPLTMLEALKINFCWMLQYKKLHHLQPLTLDHWIIDAPQCCNYNHSRGRTKTILL